MRRRATSTPGRPPSQTPQFEAGSEAGFTLLETMIALTIVALAAALALPRVNGTGADLASRTAAARLAGELRSLRAEALRTNREQVMIVDARARTFTIGSAALTGQGSRPFPRGVDITLLTIRSEQVDPATGRLRFYPDGSSTGGRITLTSGRRSTAVVVDWLTGGTRVEGGP